MITSSHKTKMIKGVSYSRVKAITGGGRCTRYAAIKPVLDGGLALVMLIISIPFVLLAMILVKMTSNGPALFPQRRLGNAGRTITIYKIRTMYQGCERHSGPIWSLPGDRRVTPVGRFLRRAHLDELPQLVNVLRGEMSLIGPRPERPEIAQQLGRSLPDYSLRLQVRPGLTGLAQLLQPPETDLASVRRKMDYDLYYVEWMSLWLDLRILLGTVLHLMSISGDWIALLLRFPCASPHHRGEAAETFPTNSRVQPYEVY